MSWINLLVLSQFLFQLVDVWSQLIICWEFQLQFIIVRLRNIWWLVAVIVVWLCVVIIILITAVISIVLIITVLIVVHLIVVWVLGVVCINVKFWRSCETSSIDNVWPLDDMFWADRPGIIQCLYIQLVTQLSPDLPEQNVEQSSWYDECHAADLILTWSPPLRGHETTHPHTTSEYSNLHHLLSSSYSYKKLFICFSASP